MKASFFALFGFAATAIAFPGALNSRQVGLCSSGTPQCCDVDVLGVADLDCETRKSLQLDLALSDPSLNNVFSPLRPH